MLNVWVRSSEYCVKAARQTCGWVHKSRATALHHTVSLLSAAAILACGEIADPQLPSGAVPMDPPSVYAMWWRLTEVCSGVNGDFESVRWFQLPDAPQFAVHDTLYQSYWWLNGNRIVIVGAKRFAGQLVRHEMLHALTGPHHQREYFVDKCRGVVACEANCLKEARPLPVPKPDAPTIRATDLAVETVVESTPASAATDSGWAAITISARNTQGFPTWVSLTPVAPGQPAAATFGYVFECAVGACSGRSDYLYIFDDKIGLDAGGFRQYVFDLRLPSGRYSVRGFFNVDTAQRTTFEISP
jgi:hypothetical protein